MNSQASNLQNGFEILWYQIDSVLGRGGFGITYLARDTNLNQMVAIKEYLPHDYASRSGDSTVQPDSKEHDKVYAWGLDRFMSEAQTLAKFKHPNIVRVLSVFKLNNTGYMVMEYETGKDLKSLYKDKKMTQAELESIYYPIMDGLSQVHREGFIHRDIKPANIYIRSDGSPVLLDFGSARQAIGTATRTLTAMLSVGYAPIEQYNDGSGKQGPWTDIYSIGASMYQAITGKMPTESTMRGMSMIHNEPDPYSPLSHRRIDGFSPHFLRAIDQSLKLQIQDRPQTIEEFLDMLTGAVTLPDIPPKKEVKESDVNKTVIMPRGNDSANTWSEKTDEVTELAAVEENNLPQDQKLSTSSAKSGDAESSVKQASVKRTGIGKLAGVLAIIVLMLAAGQAAFQYFKQPATDQSKQQKIDALLQQAEQHFQAENYFDPNNENALSLFNEALVIDSRNSDALAGQNKIGQHYLAVAKEAIKNKNFKQANNSLKIINSLDPNFDGLKTLQSRLDTQQKQVLRSSQIQQNLGLANAAFERNDIYSPKGNNAYHFYKKVLLLDANNATAIQGIQKSGERLRADIKTAIRTKSPETESLMQLAEEIDPDLQGLVALKQEVEQSSAMKRLLAKADLAYRKGHYINPAEDNAIKWYRQILNKDSRNQLARSGINKITSHFVLQANNFVKAGKIKSAELSLKTVSEISPDHRDIRKLQKDIDLKKREIEQSSAMDRLQVKADQAFRKGRYTFPAEDNALKWYRQILKKDSQNQIARSGIKKIADYFALKARNYVKAGKIKSAEQSLETVIDVLPGHRDINKLQKDIDRKKKIKSISNLIPQGINQKKNDTAVVEDILGAFMLSFRSQDVAGMEKIAQLKGPNKAFFSSLFSAYIEMNIKVESFRVIKSVGKAEIDLRIHGLINKEGNTVVTSAEWTRINLKIYKKFGYWLKAEISQ